MDRKAAAQAVKDKQAAEQAEAATARDWKQGANNRKAGRDAATADREAEKLRLAEEKRLALAADEEATGSIKPTKKKGKKKGGEDPLLALLAEGSKKPKTKFEKMEVRRSFVRPHAQPAPPLLTLVRILRLRRRRRRRSESGSRRLKKRQRESVDQSRRTRSQCQS